MCLYLDSGQIICGNKFLCVQCYVIGFISLPTCIYIYKTEVYIVSYSKAVTLYFHPIPVPIDRGDTEWTRSGTWPCSGRERERLEPPSREINPLIRLPRENPPDLPFHPCNGSMSGIVNVQSLSRSLHGSTLNDLSRALDRMERYPGPVSFLLFFFPFFFGDGFVDICIY